MIKLTRNLFLFVIGFSTAAALKAEVSPVCFKDTVLINGRILFNKILCSSRYVVTPARTDSVS